ncbi:carbohydrate ABC transporter permease [Paraburkholderia susongensis]|uniref:Carbohydrate ABC transporter membrane protein 2, CUT1 family n=1 Tax=Paraburkholderia susongensis TaxID=1515439 RepID=A0A1X7LKN8_9BURK|nr:carbohydrate ABC transporter permease [Paraburkholderia susongensis]SMG53729.1 carbohydrate ABC transporter membrane protein 2, CUT1 family [Paraburkholderia susongensis]
MFPTPIAQTTQPVQWLYRVALPVSLVVWLLPLIAIVLTSLRGPADILAGNYWGMPTQWHVESNYVAIFEGTPLARYLLNSFLITLPAVAGAVALSCLSGFALGVYRFRMNLPVFFLFVAGNFVPFQILMVPVRTLSLRLGLYDSVLGLVLFHTAFQSGFCTFFMRNFILDLPRELIDAARMDGATEFQIFRRVVLPLVKPAIAAVSILIFTFVWNDYFWATVLIQGNHAMPVTAGLRALNGQWVAQWHLVAAGSLVAALPPIVIFFIKQRDFITGLTMGATKG